MNQKELIGSVKWQVFKTDSSQSFQVDMPTGLSDKSKRIVAAWLADLYPKSVKCYSREHQMFVKIHKRYPIAANVYFVEQEIKSL